MPGSHYLSAPNPSGCFVDNSAPRLPRPYFQHSARFSLRRVLAGWKRGIAGVQAQPPGLRSNPTFSLANSPVSPVDSELLLTASSRAVCQEWHAIGVAADSKKLNSAETDFTAPYTRFGACLLRLGTGLVGSAAPVQVQGHGQSGVYGNRWRVARADRASLLFHQLASRMA